MSGQEQTSMTGGTPRAKSIAYFSMEIALEAWIPTYSGGLGVLAGDIIRAAADRGPANGRRHALIPQRLLLSAT
jgi:glucan phosphorylase